MSDDYYWIKRIEEQLQAVQQVVQQQAIVIDELRGRLGTVTRTVSALVEVLVDASQLDGQELAARVAAAAINEQHQAREASAASQDAWEAMAPKGK